MKVSGPAIFFRADASLKTGTGHVMRCLTLADALRKTGLPCSFICRTQPNDLVGVIRQRGYFVHALPSTLADRHGEQYEDQDSEETLQVLPPSQINWVVVDHYQLGGRWEQQIRARCRGMVVIDDLANRAHDCDVLIDQNLGRLELDYMPLVPRPCRLLVGPQYALLRPEFAKARAHSLQRRKARGLERLLISMGGFDADNSTGLALAAMQHGGGSPDMKITVVVGRQAPWLRQIRAQAAALSFSTQVLEDVSDMAKVMSENDLAVGAAGGTAYERCCLGLPSILVILAENQRPGAMALARANAATLLGEPSALVDLPRVVSQIGSNEGLSRMSAAASAVVDGIGAERVCQTLGVLIGRDQSAGLSATSHDGGRS